MKGVGWLIASSPNCQYSPGFEFGIPEPAGICEFLLGEPANRVGIATAGWPLRCSRGTKKCKKNKKYMKKKEF